MQPKIGGKLLLKLNTGTTPIANKYHEGKMKSTLKRKLIVRETVRREAHGISNALSRFRRSVLSTGFLRIRMDRCHPFTQYWLSHFPSVCINRCCNQVIRLAERWLVSASVAGCDVPARIRQRCRSTCPHGLASASSVRRHASALELHRAVGGKNAHCA